MSKNTPDLKLITTEYDESGSVIVECANGHITPIILSHLYDRKRCPRCNEHRKIDIDTVRVEFEEEGYILLSKEYVKNTDTIEFICPIHGYQTIIYANFIQGARCKECGYDLISEAIFIPLVEKIKEFDEMYGEDFELLTTEDNYNGVHTIVTVLHKKCGKPFDAELAVLTRQKMRCKNCQRYGEYSSRWDGGITPIHRYLREHISDWKQKSIEKCNYKCVITGERFDNVHHLRGFNTILKEIFDVTGLKIEENLSIYENKDLELLISTCQQLHNKYGLGVCLSEEVHKQFHSQYKYGSNTNQQWIEFVSNNYPHKLNLFI